MTCHYTNAPTEAHILSNLIAIDAMSEPLRSRGYHLIDADLSRPTAAHVRVLLQAVDIVLLDVALADANTLAQIREVSAAIGLCDVKPRILCFSTLHCNARFVSDVEKCGARYARVSDAGTLVESIELLLFEMDRLRRSGPLVHILHRFAQGTRSDHFTCGCAPGEEVAAVLLPQANQPQLPLSLTERCIVDILASHRRVALDAAQIVGVLTAEWFYRDHACNSGVPQRIKVRVPTVKVSIGRIRAAVAVKLAEAHLEINAYDVVESVPVVGSNRVLYKLNADAVVIHTTG